MNEREEQTQENAPVKAISRAADGAMTRSMCAKVPMSATCAERNTHKHTQRERERKTERERKGEGERRS